MENQVSLDFFAYINFTSQIPRQFPLFVYAVFTYLFISFYSDLNLHIVCLYMNATHARISVDDYIILLCVKHITVIVLLIPLIFSYPCICLHLIKS